MEDYDFMEVVIEIAYFLWDVFGQHEEHSRIWCSKFTLESSDNTRFFIGCCLTLIRADRGEEWMIEQGVRGLIAKLFSRLNRYVDLEMEEEFL
jgi:hypothetical protein